MVRLHGPMLYGGGQQFDGEAGWTLRPMGESVDEMETRMGPWVQLGSRMGPGLAYDPYKREAPPLDDNGDPVRRDC